MNTKLSMIGALLAATSLAVHASDPPQASFNWSDSGPPTLRMSWLISDCTIYTADNLPDYSGPGLPDLMPTAPTYAVRPVMSSDEASFSIYYGVARRDLLHLAERMA